MSKIKRPSCLSLILGVVVLFAAFSIWYKYTYSMDRVQAFEVNTPNLETKLLIATQGSDFKEAVLSKVIDHFKSRFIYIKVIDVHELAQEEIDEWKAICILHTWEIQKPPQVIADFFEQHPNIEHVAVLTTAADGQSKMENVDAITGASVMEEVDARAQKLIERTEAILTKSK